MSFVLQQVDEGLELALRGRVNVQHATSLWESLQETLLDDTIIRLNAEELEEMDTSIVQILCQLRAMPGKLLITSISDGFVLSLKRRGLANLFIDPPARASQSADTKQDENLEPQSELNHAAETMEEGIPA